MGCTLRCKIPFVVQGINEINLGPKWSHSCLGCQVANQTLDNVHILTDAPANQKQYFQAASAQMPS